MLKDFEPFILSCTNSTSITQKQSIQSLWSGYGEIAKLTLEGPTPSVVIKHIQFPRQQQHPRGWNSSISHQRKITSYKVEKVWYEQYNQLCPTHCKTPQYLDSHQIGDEVVIILENLDESGFAIRKTALTLQEITLCLEYLAAFHATFMGTAPKSLWQQGTYWHLETRPEELEALEDHALKKAASAIDEKLAACQFKTLVHGDAKLANFCFASDVKLVKDIAMVDFQYVGGGCGMKDVAYFLGSCLSESELEIHHEELLQHYFQALEKELNSTTLADQAPAIVKEWTALFPWAWADFHRFLKGWSPGHWKINSFSERLSKEVVKLVNER